MPLLDASKLSPNSPNSPNSSDLTNSTNLTNSLDDITLQTQEVKNHFKKYPKHPKNPKHSKKPFAFNTDCFSFFNSFLENVIEITEGYRQACYTSVKQPAFPEEHQINLNNNYHNDNIAQNLSNPLKIQKTKNPQKILERLMRINHTGEICAQALYQAQMRFAQRTEVFNFLKQAKKEEEAHLGWCQRHIEVLGGRVSYLNPFWYGASYLIGMALAQRSDATSLGFTYHTEEQVSAHLAKHLIMIEKIKQMPDFVDIKQQEQINIKEAENILQQMKQEELEHGEKALNLGGKKFSPPARLVMKILAKVMTKTVYYI